MRLKVALVVVVLLVIAGVVGWRVTRPAPPSPRVASDADLTKLIGLNEAEMRERLGEPDFVSPPTENSIVVSYHEENGSPILVHVESGRVTRISRMENGKLKDLQ